MPAIRHQRRIKGGGREPIWGALDPAIKKAVTADARHFQCSISFVVNTALANAMGIPCEHYYEAEKVKRLRRVK